MKADPHERGQFSQAIREIARKTLQKRLPTKSYYMEPEEAAQFVQQAQEVDMKTAQPRKVAEIFNKAIGITHNQNPDSPAWGEDVHPGLGAGVLGPAGGLKIGAAEELRKRLRTAKESGDEQTVRDIYYALDAEKMHQAGQYLLGEHDFTSFRAQSCQSQSPSRLMHFVDVYRDEQRVIIDICANAFLHHMVRNITGVLLDVGMGRQPVSWTQDLLAIKDRSQAAMTAPPHGLHLGGVYYPERYGINRHPLFDRLPVGASRFD